MKPTPLSHSIAAMMFSLAALSSCRTTPVPTELLGDPAPVSAAIRTINIAPDTRSVNVTDGEIIKFTVGDKAFAWNFDGALTVDNFPLNQVAPPGLLDHPVQAYVAPDPTYEGGGDGDRHHGSGGHGGDHGGGHGGGHK
ncbi:CzcE family metal-binding protein [Undibacterium sp.]|uniref:CzcE family metal-binding protein n=1 Tax=Undibacterium sp. TaxID=1914977 RepID=UPI002D020BFC|nr:CzcE family metal-binding protein [Undibacterium sp.]HTD02237.1 CzcE family metal-binding protein [Undibacterium sp.]